MWFVFFHLTRTLSGRHSILHRGSTNNSSSNVVKTNFTSHLLHSSRCKSHDGEVHRFQLFARRLRKHRLYHHTIPERRQAKKEELYLSYTLQPLPLHTINAFIDLFGHVAKRLLRSFSSEVDGSVRRLLYVHRSRSLRIVS